MGRRGVGGLNDPLNESQGGTNANNFNTARTNMGLNNLINAQTLGYTAITTDRNKLIHYTGAGGVTLAFDPAATLLNGWATIVRNDAATSITLNPNGGELINGAATLTLQPLQAIIVYCDGTAFYTEGEALQRLALSGGTMTGSLILAADPVLALEAATKQYVDAIASGLNFKDPVLAASVGAFTVTYANGAAGVGATLTNAGVMAAFSIDGVSPSLTDRVLIKDQASTFQNGIYTVTTVGSGAVNWVLTRATDYDTPAEIQPGDFVLVTSGTVNSGTAWIQTATVATVGTDPILFTQFGGGNFAPIDAEYLVLSTNPSLTDERVFTPGGGLDATDAGAGSTYTMFAKEMYNPQTGGYTADATDRAKVIYYTGAGGVTLALTAAATLGDGWFCMLRNSSAGVITVDPAGGETINGAATLAVSAGQAIIINCNGSLFTTIGEAATAASSAQFLTLALDGTLPNERVYTPGGGLAGVDAGAGSTYTVNVTEVYNPQTGGYTADATDRSKVIYYTGAGGVTLALTAAATLGNGWFTMLRNSSSGTITVDPNGGETINGAATLAVSAGQAIIINCNGTLFTTIGEASSAVSTAQFLTLAVDGALPNERVLTPGGGLAGIDAGAGGTYTLNNTRVVNAQTAGYTAVASDRGKVIRYTGAGGVTLALDPAATLADGWFTVLRNDSSGIITIDPSAAETINGAATLAVSAGQSVEIYCNGTLFYTLGDAVTQAPASAQFLTLATDATLVNERVFTPGGGLQATDAGAGSTYTLASAQVVNAQTAGYTADATDRGKVIRYTGAGGVTLALTAAATLTNGWYTTLRNDSSGTITIDPNGAETIDGAATLAVTAGNSVIIYCNGTLFYTVGSATGGGGAGSFITATGGTITTDGDYKVHTFNSSADFEITDGSGSVQFLIVAGGGGSGRGSGTSGLGGGGAGGYITSSIYLGIGVYPVVIGAGGAGRTGSAGAGSQGNPSVFPSYINATGGGLGAAQSSAGGAGGSGGGASGTAAGGAATFNQGFAGGTGTSSGGSGGGGASAVGTNATGSTGTAGGAGLASSITGSSVTRAGGGGGGSNSAAAGGAGGAGGGGAGQGGANVGVAGTANTGGGAGGPGFNNADGANGGSGVVIMRYKFQ